MTIAEPSASKTEVVPLPSDSSSVVLSSRPLPSAPISMLGRSPAWAPCGFSAPCWRLIGLKWPPADAKSGGSHLPTAWTCTPWAPRGRPWPSTTTRTTLPTCVKVAVPAGWPAAVRSSARAVLSVAGAPPMLAHPASSTDVTTAINALMVSSFWRGTLGGFPSNPSKAPPGSLKRLGGGEQVHRRQGQRLGAGHDPRPRHRRARPPGELARVAGHAVRRDPDVGMDRRQPLAHVAAVGGAVAGLPVVGILREVDELEILREESGHGGVRLEGLVHGRIVGDRDAAAGGGSGALGGRREAPQQLPAIVHGDRAQVELGAGVLGDDVGLLAALRDDAVHAGVGTDLLAHRIERVEEA